MANCPCGETIKDWETVCSLCWKDLEKYDKEFGSNFQEAILKHFKNTGRRDVLNLEMLRTIKKRIGVPRRTERIESLRLKMKQYCKECEEISGKKDIDICFNCSFHSLINTIYKEILYNGN